MKAFLASNSDRRAKALVALSLTTAALVLLLGAWSWLSPAKARESAAVGLGNIDLILSSSDTITKSVFLPIVFRSDVVFYDDFSNTSSGWPHQVTFDKNCYAEYREGRYRVKVTKKDRNCLIANLNIPKLENGTFSMKVRRATSEWRTLRYGFIFGAGEDATKDRWVLEVYPNDDKGCDPETPLYWLAASVDGELRYFKKKCTTTINKDKNDWNDLVVIRNGQNIKVYINGNLLGDYYDASYLLDEGYSLLWVVSLSDEDIYVEFDDFEIRHSTAPL
jgi:hypothetical protein